MAKPPQAPVLYVMVGFPGAGKTTVAKTVAQLTGAVHVWADQERLKMFAEPTLDHHESLILYERLNRYVEDLLHDGKSVVFDTSFNFYKDRQHMQAIAERSDAGLLILWVKTPKELARTRAVYDAAGQPTRPFGNMPLENFEKKSHSLQPPRAKEPVIEIDGRAVTPDYIAELLESRSKGD